MLELAEAIKSIRALPALSKYAVGLTMTLALTRTRTRTLILILTLTLTLTPTLTLTLGMPRTRAARAKGTTPRVWCPLSTTVTSTQRILTFTTLGR